RANLDPPAHADGQRPHRTLSPHDRRADRRARAGGLRPGQGRDRGDHHALQPSPAAFVVEFPAAGGLLSWKPRGAAGRAPRETGIGQGTAQAGESQIATTAAAVDGGQNRTLFRTAKCLTLSETFHSDQRQASTLSTTALIKRR